LASNATHNDSMYDTFNVNSCPAHNFLSSLNVFFYTHRVKNSSHLVEAFDVDRIYLRHKNQGLAPDYRVSNVACKMQHQFHIKGP